MHTHRHRVVGEIRDDPDRAADYEKDDQHAEDEGQNVVCIVGSAAEMQKKYKVYTDLCEGKDDKPHWYAWRPQQVCLRDDERSDRRQDRKSQAHAIG